MYELFLELCTRIQASVPGAQLQCTIVMPFISWRYSCCCASNLQCIYFMSCLNDRGPLHTDIWLSRWSLVSCAKHSYFEDSKCTTCLALSCCTLDSLFYCLPVGRIPFAALFLYNVLVHCTGVSFSSHHAFVWTCALWMLWCVPVYSVLHSGCSGVRLCTNWCTLSALVFTCVIPSALWRFWCSLMY